MAPRPESLGTMHRVGGCLLAILGQRCPRCWTGKIFRGRFTMNDPCPLCGLVFEREEGYFLGAMYISYGMSSVLLIAFFLLGLWLLPGWNEMLVGLLAVVAYLPFMPAVFRYARVLWIYLERFACPSSMSAGAYEKYWLKRSSEEDAAPTQ